VRSINILVEPSPQAVGEVCPRHSCVFDQRW